MYADLVVGRVGSCGASGSSTKGTNAVRVHGLATSVHQGVVGLGIRVDSSWRMGSGISTWVAVAVRVGHARGHSSRHLAVGAGGGVAPSSVATLVLGHLKATNGRQGWVVVGIEAILFHLFSALVFCALALLALAPEEDTSQDEQSNNDNGNDDGNGSLAAGAETTAVFVLRILETSRAGACWRDGA